MGKKYKVQIWASQGIACARIVDEDGNRVSADFTTSSTSPVEALYWESLEKKSLFSRMKPNRLKVNLGIVEATWNIKPE